jgi:hypothetical protein
MYTEKNSGTPLPGITGEKKPMKTGLILFKKNSGEL